MAMLHANGDVLTSRQRGVILHTMEYFSAHRLSSAYETERFSDEYRPPERVAKRQTRADRCRSLDRSSRGL